MTQQKNLQSWKSRAAICLAMTAIIFAGAPLSRASGEKASERDVGTATTHLSGSASGPGSRNRGREIGRVNSLAEMRDPFKVPPPPRPGKDDDGLEGPLPPGVRGLVIGRLKLIGIVREEASNTMIAVVTDRRNLAYFLRVHDRVYNGVVSGIMPGSMRFVGKGPNAAGQGESRDVVLKLGSGRLEAR